MIVGTWVSPGPGPRPSGWRLLINRVILKAAACRRHYRGGNWAEKSEGSQSHPGRSKCPPHRRAAESTWEAHRAPHLLDTLFIKSSPTGCRANCAHFTDEKDEVESGWKSSPWSESQKVGKEPGISTPTYISTVCAPDHLALGLTRVHMYKLYNL